MRTVRLAMPAGGAPPPTVTAGFVHPVVVPEPQPERQAAPALATADPPPRSDRRRAVRSPWLWTAVAVVAAASVTAVVIARRSDRPDLVNGTLDPGRVEVGE
jgi:hypothetical protein